MFVIRPIREEELEDLERFAHGTRFGMLSLPRDPELLKSKIARSIRSFRKELTSPKDELYLFVLEDTATGKVGGSCGILTKTGVHDPLYYFRLKTTAPPKSRLPLSTTISLLYPTVETNGPSELCALYLDQSLRREHLGELLSRSRFLFIAEHLYRFSRRMTARLRGYIHKKTKTSPFWEGLGKHFLEMDFAKTQTLLQRGNAFVPAFLPKHPIYACLLPKSVQSVMRRAHDSAKPALILLKKEGFQLADQMDIFDGGPAVACKTAEIYSVKNSRPATVNKILEEPFQGGSYIISNTSLDFRAAYGKLKNTKGNAVILTSEVATALRVNIGDSIRYIRSRLRHENA